MSTASKRLAIMGVTAFCAVFLLVPKTYAQSGLTVTPATLTLSLAAGNTSQTEEITITNQYAQPVSLQFAFEQRVDQTSGADPSSYLHISQTTATVGAGESLHQTITLSDDAKLSPGSQLADLVITQIATPGNNVGVLPSIRIPLILVKQDGAVTSISLAAFSTPHFGLLVPGSLSATVRNDGNMIAIPHGVITITAPNGSVVRKGIVNSSSLAVSPGAKLALTTTLQHEDRAFWPGVYKATISYGLGGGQMATVASKRFFYLTWWHALALLSLGMSVFYAVKLWPRKTAKKPPAHHPPKPKQRVLIGRNA